MCTVYCVRMRESSNDMSSVSQFIQNPLKSIENIVLFIQKLSKLASSKNSRIVRWCKSMRKMQFRLLLYSTSLAYLLLFRSIRSALLWLSPFALLGFGNRCPFESYVCVCVWPSMSLLNRFLLAATAVHSVNNSCRCRCRYGRFGSVPFVHLSACMYACTDAPCVRFKLWNSRRDPLHYVSIPYRWCK